MTIIFIAWGNYSGFQDAVVSAERLSGCRVIVASEFPVKCESFYPVQSFCGDHQSAQNLRSINGGWTGLSLARWLVLGEIVHSLHDITWPVFCPDWDVLFCGNLEAAYAPFTGCDYAASFAHGVWSAAYAINHVAVIDGFCEFISRLGRESPDRVRTLNDMAAWDSYQYQRAFPPLVRGDLFEIHNGSVFDHNMHCGWDRFVMAPQTDKILSPETRHLTFSDPKEIRWISNRPYFVLLDGTLIRANTIHCWGSYKKRTSELLRRMNV